MKRCYVVDRGPEYEDLYYVVAQSPEDARAKYGVVLDTVSDELVNRLGIDLATDGFKRSFRAQITQGNDPPSN